MGGQGSKPAALTTERPKRLESCNWRERVFQAPRASRVSEPTRLSRVLGWVPWGAFWIVRNGWCGLSLNPPPSLPKFPNDHDSKGSFCLGGLTRIQPRHAHELQSRLCLGCQDMSTMPTMVGVSSEKPACLNCLQCLKCLQCLQCSQKSLEWLGCRDATIQPF